MPKKSHQLKGVSARPHAESWERSLVQSLELSFKVSWHITKYIIAISHSAWAQRSIACENHGCTSKIRSNIRSEASNPTGNFPYTKYIEHKFNMPVISFSFLPFFCVCLRWVHNICWSLSEFISILPIAILCAWTSTHKNTFATKKQSWPKEKKRFFLWVGSHCLVQVLMICIVMQFVWGKMKYKRKRSNGGLSSHKKWWWL